MRVAPLVPFAALVLAGCGSGGFLADPACDAPITDLSPDLTAHIASGTGEGQFSYDPAGAALRALTGAYDPETGDFSWTEVANEDSWFETAVVGGYGYANPNGDLDIIGERVVSDINAYEYREQFRVERTGCRLERRRREWTNSGEIEEVETGTYQPSSYVYEIEQTDSSGERLIEGTRFQTLDYTESITEERSGYSFEGERAGNLGDGEWVLTSQESISSRNGNIARETVRESFLDRSQSVEVVDTYASGAKLTYEYELDYLGNGSGTLTGSGLSCSLVFAQGLCRYSCTNGDRGGCSVY